MEPSRHSPSAQASEAVRKQIAVYTAIAGAMAASSAAAAPFTSPFPVPVEVINSSFDTQETRLLDIDGDGTTDFTVKVYYLGYCAQSYISPAGGNQVTGEFSYAGLVSPGGNISDASTFTDVGIVHSQYECRRSLNGPVGIRFESGSDTHYGYLDVESIQETEVRYGIIIKAACFESEPDTAIEAGAPCRGPSHAIPVGGAIPLTLGLLTIGAAALRRRRQQLS